MTDIQHKTRRKAREVAADIWRRELPDGSRIAEVPLSCGGFAIVDEGDLGHVLAPGISPAWFLNGGGYVRTRAPTRLGIGNNVQVARVIMEPPARCVVKYRDGNKLNLRRANLYLEKTNRTPALAREQHFGALAAAAE